ncbi:MAG TPA: VIT and VWA domain-containing protein [Blastocatellia bacterium]|nr:VIT and VWA domain-containing protein [Blastocatellia bacterium]
MQRRLTLSFALLSALCIVGYITLAKVARTRGTIFSAAASGSITQGSLQVLDPEKGTVAAECPLKHTDVKAEVSGFLSRVVVTQEFENPFKDKIEAVYTFPLPQNAAVDDMTMRVGDRTVRGRIKRREEARAVYEAARRAGNVASLLDQERPNIFTQSVANIMPGEKVTVTISYVETLKYEDGSYEFVFPMVVGPRYIPGAPTGKQSGGWSPDTTQVPDASRITPPVAAKGTRAGHDISIEVALDAGVTIDNFKSTNHDIDSEKLTDHSAFVRLKNKAEIPNKDFILKFDVAGRKIEDAVLTHRAPRGDTGDGFFTMILQPPERVAVEDVMPKEIVFVIDTSGSMMGFPIEKAKESMKLALDGLYPQDTFNLITFAGDTHILFPQPVPATRDNLRKAQDFLASRSGGGGTEMMKAIRAALDPSDAQARIRIVCFMTDGYVGNDMEIISEVQKHSNARVFSFGIGQSVNRFLLDKMAEQGRGEVEYVSLNDDGSAAARRFHERIRNPLLTDISIDWSGLPVTDIYPKLIPDLFSAKPVVIRGRYTSGAKGVIKLKGKAAGRDFVREIAVELPDSEPRRDVLATLWARTRIDDLMSQDYGGIQSGNAREDVKEAITQIGLNYRLMTQFTSFVAVEEMTVTDGGQPRKVEVPVEMPEGVSHEGVFGNDKQAALTFTGRIAQQQLSMTANAPSGQVAASSPQIPKAETVRPMPPPPERGRKVKGDRTADGEGRGQVSPEDVKRQQVLAKLHPSIAAVVERLKNKNAQPASDEAKFVSGGKAEIQIWLSDKSPETLAKLKQLGFEVVLDPKTAKIVIGRVPIERLAAMAELAAVRYIAPQT